MAETPPPIHYIAAIVAAQTDRAAVEERLNEAILVAVEAGHSYGELSAATGVARGWLHTRASRAKSLRRLHHDTARVRAERALREATS